MLHKHFYPQGFQLTFKIEMHCVECHAGTEDLHNAVMPVDIFRLFNQLCLEGVRQRDSQI